MPVNSTIRCNDTNIVQIGNIYMFIYIYIYEIINNSKKYDT